jgi:hypothetical protein
MTNPQEPAAAEPSPDLPPADPAKMATETTPVGDSVQTETTEPVEEGADEPPATEAPETAKSFQVDIGRALQRETQDGKGDEEPGESDWAGYATEGVEVEEASQ